MTKKGLFIVLLLILVVEIKAQVNWLSFSQLDSALNVSPRPVLIDFYTDWCTYCKKMDREVFPSDAVSEKLNSMYYAVRFDAESDERINFDGSSFTKTERAQYHELAVLLATRNNQFAPPTLVFLDAQFNIQERVFQYMSRKQMIKKLEKHSLK